MVKILVLTWGALYVNLQFPGNFICMNEKLLRGFQSRSQWQQSILKCDVDDGLPTYQRDTLESMIKGKVIGWATILKLASPRA